MSQQREVKTSDTKWIWGEEISVLALLPSHEPKKAKNRGSDISSCSIRPLHTLYILTKHPKLDQIIYKACAKWLLSFILMFPESFISCIKFYICSIFSKSFTCSWSREFSSSRTVSGTTTGKGTIFVCLHYSSQSTALWDFFSSNSRTWKKVLTQE